jgi:methylase of polypeptide subunit release factors
MDHPVEETRQAISTFRTPERKQYRELDAYSCDDCYRDFFGGGGLYLAMHMLRTLRLKPNDLVLDLGCGKGATSVFMAKHYGVRVIALDLWTSAEYLDESSVRKDLQTASLRSRWMRHNRCPSRKTISTRSFA